MSPWTRKPLGDLVVNHDAQRIPVRESERKAGPYPYYGASGIVDHVDEFIFEGLHLLIAEDGENLRTRQTPIAFLADGQFWVNNHAHIVTGKPDIADTRYLCYALAATDIAGFLTGSAMPKLSQRAMNTIEVVLPSFAEQLTIAAVLGSLDDKIEQNRRTGRKLEALARAVFKAWFVDFEPVKAKAAGATAFPGMPPETFATLPTRLVDSELGPVPEGWEIGKFSDCATLSKEQIDPQEKADEVFEHYSIPAFDAGQYAAPEFGSAIKSQKFVVMPECVLFSKLNPRIPRVWLPPASDKLRQIASTEFLVLSPKATFDRYFLFCILQNPIFSEALAQGASGTSNSHQRIRPNDLLARTIALAPADIRTAFKKPIEPLMMLRASQHAESRKLATLRNYLLPRLLSGRVRVRSCQPEIVHVDA